MHCATCLKPFCVGCVRCKCKCGEYTHGKSHQWWEDACRTELSYYYWQSHVAKSPGASENHHVGGTDAEEPHLHFSQLFKAYCGGDIGTLKRLLKKNPAWDINSVLSADGWTAFHCACSEGKVEVLELLLSSARHLPLNVNAVSSSGYTGLSLACQSGHIEVVARLLKRNDVSTTIGCPLHVACTEDNYDMAVAVAMTRCSRVNVNYIPPADSPIVMFRGKSPLYVACETGCVQCVRLLMKTTGIDANLTSSMFPETPLQVAARKGHIEKILRHYEALTRAAQLLEKEKREKQEALEQQATELTKERERALAEQAKALKAEKERALKQQAAILNANKQVTYISPSSREQHTSSHLVNVEMDAKLALRDYLRFPKGFQPRPCVESLLGQDLAIPLLQLILSAAVDFTDDMLFAPPEIIASCHLTREEVLAIVIYTFDIGVSGPTQENLYYVLNRDLRNRLAFKIEIWSSFLFTLLSALAKLPNFKGVTYRGLPADAVATMRREYINERIVRWTGFTSTGKHESAARGFAGRGGVLIKLLLLNGRAIQDLSYVSMEDEVIVSPNTTFQVTQPVSSTEDSQGQFTLVLKELPKEDFLIF
ncbi:hypothetical protein Pelo_9168 [Pelomyxa schiedti]|nr:hypothetical protein Pelo_9168 [Pelomyxa schiedti]